MLLEGKTQDLSIAKAVSEGLSLYSFIFISMMVPSVQYLNIQRGQKFADTWSSSVSSEIKSNKDIAPPFTAVQPWCSGNEFDCIQPWDL